MEQDLLLRDLRSATFAGRSWCPEVGLRSRALTFRDRSEVGVGSAVFLSSERSVSGVVLRSV